MIKINKELKALIPPLSVSEFDTVSKEFDFKGWFDQEVKELEQDPEYIANGLMIELAAQVAQKLQSELQRRRLTSILKTKAVCVLLVLIHAPPSLD